MNLKALPSSFTKSNLLSLAKNMSRSSLLSKSTLKPQSSTSQHQHSSNQSSSSNLIYSNIVSSKERSRSVNAMINSLLKTEANPTERATHSNNLNPISNISTPSTYSNIPLSINRNTKQSNNNLTHNKSNNDQHEIYNKNKATNSRCSTNHTNGSICYNGMNCVSKTMQMTYEEDDTSQKEFNIRRNNQQNNNNNKKVYRYYSPLSDVETVSKDNDDNYKEYSNKKYNCFKKCTQNITAPNKNNNSIHSNHNNIKSINGIFNGTHRYKHQNNIINPKSQPITIQLEDLIVLEEKLSHIYNNINQNNKTSINKLCIEWWSFYSYSSFNSKLDSLLKDNKETIHETSLLELLSILALYEVTKESQLSNNMFNKFKNLISEIHQNFLIICDLILTKISMYVISTQHSFWLSKIQNIILSKRSHRINRGEHYNTLKKNNEYITTILKSIFRLYTSSSTIDTNTLYFYLKRISTTAYKIINDYFTKLINEDSCKKDDSLSFVINEQTITQNVSVPYLEDNIIDNKKFTLVLDLDETLISFRREDAQKGILRLRPGLYKFLNEVKQIYEVIVFTTGTQEYADPILNAIEKQGKFFDTRLYRQHAIIIDNLFVKDLSRLGRDISKVIIVDNMPHNFGLQKENGIFIKNFYGENAKDNALIDLIPILKSIASNEDNDVRIELKKYENEIFTKITTDLKEDVK